MNKIIQLTEPLEADGEVYSELSMRKPKVKDMLAASKYSDDNMEREIYLFSSLCGLSPNNLQELDFSDYGKLQEAYESFLSSTILNAERPVSH